MPGTSLDKPGQGAVDGPVSPILAAPCSQAVRSQAGIAAAGAYGPSEHYSALQIRAAIGKLGLNPKYLALGYAGFLREDAFAELAIDMPLHIPYRKARALFDRFRPPALFSASANPEMSINLSQAGVSDHPDLS
jgi:hypothetical protein